MLRCAVNLFEASDRGEILFFLDGGEQIAITALGSFHGNADDDDFDMFLAAAGANASFDQTTERICPSGGIDFGKHGFVNTGGTQELIAGGEAPKIRIQIAPADAHSATGLVAMFKATFTASHGEFCIGEWEGMDILTPMPTKLENRQGLSWWVPPLRRDVVEKHGGKGVGADLLLDFMTPRNKASLFDAWSWAQTTLANLGSWDVDRNGKIVAQEFLDCVLTREELNRLWVADMLLQRPCVIANAWIHWDHVYRYLTLGAKLRRAINQARLAPNSSNECGWCTKMQLKHDIIVGQEWGGLPEEEQELWTNRDCDACFPNPHIDRESIVPAEMELFVHFRSHNSARPPYLEDEAKCRSLLSEGTASFPQQSIHPWGHGWLGTRENQVRAEDLVEASQGRMLGLYDAIKYIEVADQDGSNMLSVEELLPLKMANGGAGATIAGVAIDWGALVDRTQASRGKTGNAGTG